MSRKSLVAGTVLVGLPAHSAHAHSFDTGADSYAQVIEGASVVLSDPGLLIPILALGILLSLWDADGLPRAWPVYLVGLVAGIVLAAFVGEWVAVAFIGLGLVTASLAALWGRPPAPLAVGVAGLTGIGAMAVSLGGHGLFELSVFIHLGLLLGVNIAVAVAAAAARFALDRVKAPWMRIAWRVVASWMGAVLALYLAFELTGGINSVL